MRAASASRRLSSLYSVTPVGGDEPAYHRRQQLQLRRRHRALLHQNGEGVAADLGCEYLRRDSGADALSPISWLASPSRPSPPPSESPSRPAAAASPVPATFAPRVASKTLGDGDDHDVMDTATPAPQRDDETVRHLPPTPAHAAASSATVDDVSSPAILKAIRLLHREMASPHRKRASGDEPSSGLSSPNAPIDKAASDDSTVAIAQLRRVQAMVDGANASALRSSVERATFGVTRIETAAAAIAALEGVENILRLWAASVASSGAGGCSCASATEMNATAAAVVRAALSTLRATTFPVHPPPEPHQPSAVDAVARVAEQRARDLQRLALMGARPSSTTAMSPHSHAADDTPPLATPPTMKTAGAQEKKTAMSIDPDDTLARIRNCDLMLARLHARRQRRPASARTSSARTAATANASLRESARGGDGPPSAATAQATSAATSASATVHAGGFVWADAEDALAVMRLRFVYHLWRVVARAARSRRDGIALLVDKLNAARSEARALRVMLALKRSVAESASRSRLALLDENEKLVEAAQASERRAQSALERKDLTTTQLRSALESLAELRSAADELQRSPMIFDLRRALRDVESGRDLDRGVIEFRRATPSASLSANKAATSTDAAAATAARGNCGNDEQHTPAADAAASLLSDSYPPFVDWAAPHVAAARVMVEESHIDRLSAAGVGLPGYAAPRSHYEVRVSRCDLSGADLVAAAASGDSRTVQATRSIGSTNVTTAATASSSIASDTRNQAATAFYGRCFTRDRWDVEFCGIVNALLQRLRFGPADCDWNLSQPLSEQTVRLGFFSPATVAATADAAPARAAKKPTSAAVAALELSIATARRILIDSMRRVDVASDSFVTGATGLLLQSTELDVTSMEQKQARHRRGSDELELHGGVDEGLPPSATTAGVWLNRRCAVAPCFDDETSPSLPVKTLREHGLHIDCPSEILRRPEVAVRLCVVVFGLAAVRNVLEKCPVAQSAQFTEIASTLLRCLPFACRVPAHVAAAFTTGDCENSGDALPAAAFADRAAPANIPSFISRPPSAASKLRGSTMLQSSAGSNSQAAPPPSPPPSIQSPAEQRQQQQRQLRRGRELCALVQCHLATTLAAAEDDLTTGLAGGALTVRRLLKRGFVTAGDFSDSRTDEASSQ